MKVQIYLLGFLLKYGPLYGYKLKQLISENAADFTDVKLPTIYYHLERLLNLGHITVKKVKDGKRPERSVYMITETGEEMFRSKLSEALDSKYKPEFVIDTALLFPDSITDSRLRENLESSIKDIEDRLQRIKENKAAALSEVEGMHRVLKDAVFNHHQLHNEAELNWTKELLVKLDENRTIDYKGGASDAGQ